MESRYIMFWIQVDLTTMMKNISMLLIVSYKVLPTH